MIALLVTCLHRMLKQKITRHWGGMTLIESESTQSSPAQPWARVLRSLQHTLSGVPPSLLNTTSAARHADVCTLPETPERHSLLNADRRSIYRSLPKVSPQPQILIQARGSRKQLTGSLHQNSYSGAENVQSIKWWLIIHKSHQLSLMTRQMLQDYGTRLLAVCRPRSDRFRCPPRQ
jgi:hypothetical protein